MVEKCLMQFFQQPHLMASRVTGRAPLMLQKSNPSACLQLLLLILILSNSHESIHYQVYSFPISKLSSMWDNQQEGHSNLPIAEWTYITIFFLLTGTLSSNAVTVENTVQGTDNDQDKSSGYSRSHSRGPCWAGDDSITPRKHYHFTALRYV